MNRHDWYPSYKPSRQRRSTVRLRTLLVVAIVTWAAYEAGWRGYKSEVSQFWKDMERENQRSMSPKGAVLLPTSFRL